MLNYIAGVKRCQKACWWQFETQTVKGRWNLGTCSFRKVILRVLYITHLKELIVNRPLALIKAYASSALKSLTLDYLSKQFDRCRWHAYFICCIMFSHLAIYIFLSWLIGQFLTLNMKTDVFQTCVKCVFSSSLYYENVCLFVVLSQVPSWSACVSDRVEPCDRR